MISPAQFFGPGPHFENIPARAMSKFLREQGATTKVCLLHSEEERGGYSQKLAIALRVAGIFSPRYVYRRHRSLSYGFLLAPRGIEKIPGNAGWGYF